MTIVSNKGIIFGGPPRGTPRKGSHLKLQAVPFDGRRTPEGGILTRNLYLSLDPYLRLRMVSPGQGEGCFPEFEIGRVITTYGICEVIATDCGRFKVGDICRGFIGAEEFSTLSKESVMNMTVLKNYQSQPLSYFLGILGLPGLAAYASFYEIGKPKVGETIYISAAAGAVGSIVGQLAKREGLRVIGSVGTDEKVRHCIDVLKLHSVFNYNRISVAAALKKYAPDGIDIYFDNVGGETLNAALGHGNWYARYVECGMISQYNAAGQQHSFSNLVHVVPRRYCIQGFMITDPEISSKYAESFQKDVSEWLFNDLISYHESVTYGIDTGIDSFLGMFSGANIGKTIVKLSDPTGGYPVDDMRPYASRPRENLKALELLGLRKRTERYKVLPRGSTLPRVPQSGFIP